MGAGESADNPSFFPTPAEFYGWLEQHHAGASELWVGFQKKASGRPSITWPESVDQALCFGWIDGVRKSLGPESYVIRFTPRKTTSTWSAVNIRRIMELIGEGRVQPAGLRAFEARSEAKSGVYAYEQRDLAELDGAMKERFERNEKAWRYFQSQAPWYRKTATWWVVSAKREETRLKRLDELIQRSEQELPLKHLDRSSQAP